MKLMLILSLVMTLSLSVEAQNPITRRIKKDTTKKKSEVVIKEEERRPRGETRNQGSKDSYQKQFDDLVAKADEADSFREKREFLLKAKNICSEELKNNCEDLVQSKLRSAYGAEISRLLRKASESNRYNDKMDWLDKARALSEASYASNDHRQRVKDAYRSEYRKLINKASASRSDIHRRMGALRSARRFCNDYGYMLDISDCNSAISSHAKNLFNDALQDKEYDKAREICNEFDGIGNCNRLVYQRQYDDLIEEAFATSDFDRQKEKLLKARDICRHHLHHHCSRSINVQLRKIYTLELDRLLQKANSTHDLRDQLNYYAEAEGLCGEAYAPENCQARINTARSNAFNANFTQLVQDISETRDYERQKEMLKEAERLMYKGQLPDERWEEIRRLKHQIHYNQLDYLLYQNKGSFQSQMAYLEQAQAINQNYLQQSYNSKINERMAYLISNEVNSVLRFSGRSFQERLKRLDYASQLTQQLNRRERHQLQQRIVRERRGLISNEFDRLIEAARSERYLDEKIDRYDRAIQFCSHYGGVTSSGDGCGHLETERRDVIRDVYAGMLKNAEKDYQLEYFDKAKNTLSLAADVYQKYSNDLLGEMPVSSAYQRLYNFYLQSSMRYSGQNNFEKARSLLREAQQLEGNRYWVVPSNNPIQAQFQEIDRQEFDYKLAKLKEASNVNPTSPATLDLLQSAYQLYVSNQSIYATWQVNQLKSLFTTLTQQGVQQSVRDMERGQYNAARVRLVKLKPFSQNMAPQFANSNLRGALNNAFFKYYELQLLNLGAVLKRENTMGTGIAQLDELYLQLKEDNEFSGAQRIEQRFVHLYQDVFNGFQTSIFQKLDRNDFNTNVLEDQLDQYYQTHTSIFTNEEYQRVKSGISFVRYYRLAGQMYQSKNYRESIDQYEKALNGIENAPASYRRPGLADEIQRRRNDAYTAEVENQIKNAKVQTFQESQIAAYRKLIGFMDLYNLPLSAIIMEEIKALKQDIFGEICQSRSQQYFFKMESGDDALSRNNYTDALNYYQEALTLAEEYPECGIDINIIRRKINAYEAASIFQKRKLELERLQDKVYSSKREYDFKAYQEAYQSLNTFYLDNIINKGFKLNLVPYQRKVPQIRNNDFWAYVVHTYCTDRTELSFSNDLLKRLLKDRSFSPAQIENLAREMASVNYRVYGGRSYKDTFQHFEIGMSKNSRFKLFKKAYKKQYNRM